MSSRLFQYNTLGALMLGQFDGDFTVGELLEKGNYGIGTFNAMDGEMIVLDGEVYHVVHSGKASQAGKDAKLPYAAVIDYQPSKETAIESQLTLDWLEENYDEYFETNHNFYAVKIEGIFESMKCRSGKKQEKPYPKFVEATKEQNEFERQQVKGTAFGFFTPVLFGRVAANGFHMHFLSDDREFGGHIMDFSISEGKLSAQSVYSLEQELPKESIDFKNSDGHQLLDEIDEAEK